MGGYVLWFDLTTRTLLALADFMEIWSFVFTIWKGCMVIIFSTQRSQHLIVVTEALTY